MTVRPLAALCTAWAFLIACGLAWLENYAATPGAIAPPSHDWPRETSLELSADRPTLVMFLHPGCGCSRASVGELERLVAKHRSQLAVRFLMALPPGDAETQRDLSEDSAPLRELASRVPDSTCIADVRGREANLFQAQISGEIFVFTPDATLRFHGGLTARRGHLGHSAGQDALEQILAGTENRLVTTPVFGCPLSDFQVPASEESEP